MKTRRIVAGNLAETKAFAAHVVKELHAEKTRKKAMVIGLYGELGAGKTTFTKEIARLLGVTRTVSSPTFVLERIYPVLSNRFAKLIHIDAYRLLGGKELIVLGWKELLADPKNLILIEWPEKVIDVMPAKHIGIFFTHKGEYEREMHLKTVA